MLMTRSLFLVHKETWRYLLKWTPYMWMAHSKHALICSTRYSLSMVSKMGGSFLLYIYALLPDKTHQTYSRLLELIKQKTVSLGFNLAPSRFLGDFELAIKQAVDLCFSLADFKGCYFHFSQVLMRKFQALGLQMEYRNDDEAKWFFHTTAALAFVPTRFARLAWQGIKSSTPAHLPRIEEFVEYFETTWLVGNFPVQMWNVYEMKTIIQTIT